MDSNNFFLIIVLFISSSFPNRGIALNHVIDFLVQFDIAIGIIAFIVMVVSFLTRFFGRFIVLLAPILIFIVAYFIFIYPQIQKKEIIQSTSPPISSLLIQELRVGSSGEEVKILQSAFYTDTAIYSGPVTGYFGQATKNAVIKFQNKYSLPQTGEMDIQTRLKFNEIYGNNHNGDYYLSLVPTLLPQSNNVQNNITANDNGSYELVADPNNHGQYSMPNAPDEKMSTVDDLNQAVNLYRRAHGLNELSIDSKLCEVANRRSIEIASNFSHEGFDRFMSVGGGWENTGFRTLGENLWSGRFTGVHIVEFGWDKSPGHQANLLHDWRAGCGGVNGINVAFIFGK